MTSRTRNWALGFLAATLYTAGQSVNLTMRVPKVPLLELVLFEYPVWISVLLIAPLVFWLARRIPLFGDRATRNFCIHAVAGSIVVLWEFVLVEAMRRFIVVPIVLGTGIASSKSAVDYAGLSAGHPLIVEAAIDFKYYMLFFFFIYFALAILYNGYSSHRELTTARVRTQELQTLLATSQLDSLRLQLHPHFLFNTLNTVSSLMTRDVVLARRTLARLSELLRETLSGTAAHEVALHSELEFLDAYVEIQTARFGARLRVEKNVEAGAMNLLVPRMLLQPLVENSIHHGMRDGDQPLCIRIEAVTSAQSLNLIVSDDGVGLQSRKLRERVGLRNTRERLERLYGSEQQLQIEAPVSGGFTICLVLPARSRKDEWDEERVAREIA
jgi:two-component system LytT family sensor kinase